MGHGTSLREAIAFANADPGGGDTISFAPYVQGVVDLSLGTLPTITASMTIDGPGANVLTVDGQGQSGIFSLGAGANITISGLTLADGSAFKGGAIENTGGKLAVSDCTLSGNTATNGGGIYSTGTTTLTDCTLSGNSATSFGGAAFNFLGTMSLTNCTVSGNTAQSSAGLDLISNNNTLVACTVSANTGTSASSGFVAGMYIFGAASLTDTIVAGNTGPSGASDIGGPGAASGSNNVIGTGNVSGSNNRLGVTNPLLGQLAWNGGPTQTMVLLPGSPALGKGAPAGLNFDQRGFPVNSPPDIGAFQLQGPPPTATISGPTSATAQVAVTFTLTASDPTPSDQNGTFTYTVDWNGNGKDVQIVQGAASVQVQHAYAAAGSLRRSSRCSTRINGVAARSPWRRRSSCKRSTSSTSTWRS